MKSSHPSRFKFIAVAALAIGFLLIILISRPSLPIENTKSENKKITINEKELVINISMALRVRLVFWK